MKKLITAILLSASAMLSASAVCAADISVTVDGQNIKFDNPPQIINDRVMVPMRQIFAELGAEVTWDDETKTATAVKDAQYVQFKNGSAYMHYGICRDGTDSGELQYASSEILDSVPIIENDTMLIPVRAVSEAFYYDVDYSMGRVSITTPTDADGWIYYSSWTDGGHMYKIDTNGQNRQLLVAEDCYADMDFQYANGYIYYSVREPDNIDIEGQIYRIKPDGTGQERLTDAACYMPFNYDHDWHSDTIFYVERTDHTSNIYGTKGAIGKIDTKTGEAVTLVSEITEESALYQDYVYFIYASEGAKQDMSCYRVDADGEIINISGDIPVWFVSIDDETQRVWMNARDDGYYSCNLDGSDLREETSDAYYARYESDDNEEKYQLDRIYYSDDDVVVGIRNSESRIYVMNSDTTVRFAAEIPGGSLLCNIAYRNGILYAGLADGSYEYEKVYIDSLEDILGMENIIKISEEPVNGKYEVATRNMNYIPAEIDGTYIISPNGTWQKIIDDYILSSMSVRGNKLVLIRMDDNKMYISDFDGGNVTEYDEAGISYAGEGILDIHEYVMYGIVVYNDGRVEHYYHPSARKYYGYWY